MFARRAYQCWCYRNFKGKIRIRIRMIRFRSNHWISDSDFSIRVVRIRFHSVCHSHCHSHCDSICDSVCHRVWIFRIGLWFGLRFGLWFNLLGIPFKVKFQSISLGFSLGFGTQVEDSIMIRFGSIEFQLWFDSKILKIFWIFESFFNVSGRNFYTRFFDSIRFVPLLQVSFSSQLDEVGWSSWGLDQQRCSAT